VAGLNFLPPEPRGRHLPPESASLLVNVPTGQRIN